MQGVRIQIASDLHLEFYATGDGEEPALPDFDRPYLLYVTNVMSQ